jgi:hypothetical protein
MLALDEFIQGVASRAINTGADLVIDGLDLGERDSDLVNIVANAIGHALRNPDVTELDDVLNANWQCEDDQYETAAQWVRSWWDW